jgi:hypothetical protein
MSKGNLQIIMFSQMMHREKIINTINVTLGKLTLGK